jgi:hypothetical protein
LNEQKEKSRLENEKFSRKRKHETSDNEDDESIHKSKKMKAGIFQNINNLAASATSAITGFVKYLFGFGEIKVKREEKDSSEVRIEKELDLDIRRDHENSGIDSINEISPSSSSSVPSSSSSLVESHLIVSKKRGRNMKLTAADVQLKVRIVNN